MDLISLKRMKIKKNLPIISQVMTIILLFLNLIVLPGCSILCPFNDRDQQIRISPAPSGCRGSYYSFDLNGCFDLTDITDAITFTVTSGETPAGLTLDASTGMLSGILAEDAADEYSFTVQAQNTSGIEPFCDVVISIGSFMITTDYLPPACVGTSYNAVINICGGEEDFQYTIEGGPSFLSFTNSGYISERHNILTGIPDNEGEFTFDVVVTSSAAGFGTVRKTFTLNTKRELQITTPQELPMAYVGSAYELTLQACGGTPPYRWSLSDDSPALPGGLSLSTDGTISGTPLAGSEGPASLKVSVADADSSTNNKVKNMNIFVASSALTVTPLFLPAVEECNNLSRVPIARAEGGIGERHWEVLDLTSDLATSMTFHPTSELLNLSWRPVTPGEYRFRVRVRDAGPTPAEAPIVLTVNPIADAGLEFIRVYHRWEDPDNQIYLDDDRMFKILFRTTDPSCAEYAGTTDNIFTAGTSYLEIIGYCDERIPVDTFEMHSTVEYRALLDTALLNDMIDRTGGITGEYRTLGFRLRVTCMASNPSGTRPVYTGSGREIRVYRVRPGSRP